MAATDREVLDMLQLLAEARRNGDKGVPVGELARRLAIPAARIADYANRLLLCGKPPFQPDDYISILIEDGRVFVDFDQSLGVPLRLTAHEAVALVVALRAISDKAPRGVVALARSALAKIRAGLAEDVGARVRDAGERFAVEAETPADDAILNRLQEATKQCREVELRYYAWHRDEMTTRRVQPYLVTRASGAWYVVGLDRLRGEVRTFRLDRILEATETGVTFVRPEDFDPNRFRRTRLFLAPDGVRQARIRFHPPISRRLTGELADGPVETSKDGTIVATVEFVSVEGLANWILAFGPQAEVLSPSDLRQAVIDRCRVALAACR